MQRESVIVMIGSNVGLGYPRTPSSASRVEVGRCIRLRTLLLMLPQVVRGLIDL